MPVLSTGPLIASPTNAYTSISLARLRDRVHHVLRDSDRDFISNTMVDEWLNEAYIDLCARLQIPQKESTGTLTATGTLGIPSDFVSFISFSVGNDIPVWVAQGVFSSWKVPSVEPESAVMAVVFNNLIETFPTQANASYILRYAFTPTELTADTQTPSALPKEVVPRIIYYARAEALWSSGETAEGDRYFQRYSSGLPDAPRALERFNPGPAGLVPVPSPFEE